MVPDIANAEFVDLTSDTWGVSATVARLISKPGFHFDGPDLEPVEMSKKREWILKA